MGLRIIVDRIENSELTNDSSSSINNQYEIIASDVRLSINHYEG
jgi:hypothetical protein